VRGAANAHLDHLSLAYGGSNLLRHVYGRGVDAAPYQLVSRPDTTSRSAHLNVRISALLYDRPLYGDLGEFVEEGFENSDRSKMPEAVDVLLGLG
jgi:hypothetical protein